MNRYKIKGKVRYTTAWAFIEFPADISDYYVAVVRWLWGRKLSAPLNGPHITLIAGKYEWVGDHPLWRLHEGREIEVTYGNLMHFKSYWWLTVEEDRELRKFRNELGLSDTPKHPFHLTIGKDNDYVERDLTSLKPCVQWTS